MNVSVIFFLCGCYFFRVHFLYFCPSTFGQNYCCCWFPSADKRRITAVKEAARTGLENSVTEDVNRPSFKWNKINVKWMETESVPPQWLVKKKSSSFLLGCDVYLIPIITDHFSALNTSLVPVTSLVNDFSAQKPPTVFLSVRSPPRFSLWRFSLSFCSWSDLLCFNYFYSTASRVFSLICLISYCNHFLFYFCFSFFASKNIDLLYFNTQSLC